MYTKEQIVNMLKDKDVAVARALVALYNRQTADEQQTEATTHRNGMGFRPCHSFMGSEMAQFYLTKGFLTKKQIDYWRSPMKDGKMRIEIYAGQLLKIANNKVN